MYDFILIRYGEMTLKKKNYKEFLNKINQNIIYHCRAFSKLKYFHSTYRFYIELNGEDHEKVIKALNTVVGLNSYSLCKKVLPDYEEIAKVGIAMLQKEVNAKTFKIESNRGDKTFPDTSLVISQEVAKRVLPQVPHLKVDVHNPDITLSIDLRHEGTFVFVNSLPGLGGYPGGIAGSGLLMISGGIDSPVAGFLSLRKGINMYALHFASPPYTSDQALQKVVDLIERLAKFTNLGKMTLFVCPFTKIQEAIRTQASLDYLVTIMRRQMYKIAAKICDKHNINVIINGESVGQVASQTLESMVVVNEVTNIPILRPLVTYDKGEIIKLAKEIATFDISIRPFEDCCTVFVPEHPIIRPKIELVRAEEAKCHLEDLVDEAVNQTKAIELSSTKNYSIFNEVTQFEI
ncbi:MAG: tRNA uracil 4-sulfurtransferase ThiI [Bacilli bacterium]